MVVLARVGTTLLLVRGVHRVVSASVPCEASAHPRDVQAGVSVVDAVNVGIVLDLLKVRP